MTVSVRAATDQLRDLQDTFAGHKPLRIRYAPSELICQGGFYGAGVYLVTAGIVHESYRNPLAEDCEVSTSLLGPPSLIGSELSLRRAQRIHQWSCRAVTGVQLLFLEQEVFEAAVEADKELRRFVTLHLAERSHGLTRALWRSQLRPAQRVSALLREVAVFGEPTADGRVILPPEIDFRQLASLSFMSIRNVKQACRSLGTVACDGGQLVILPEASDLPPPCEGSPAATASPQ
jgi:CRP-like cAMP-binding protein